MIDTKAFRTWLEQNTAYSFSVINDTVSRVKRADSILAFSKAETYLFFLERAEEYQLLSPSVRSQLKKAIKLYQKSIEGEDQANKGAKYWKVYLHSGKGGFPLGEKEVVLLVPQTEDGITDTLLCKCETYANEQFEKCSQYDPYEFRNHYEPVTLSDAEIQAIDSKYVLS